MSEPQPRALLDGEERLFEGRPDWRAWAGWTVLGFVLVPLVVGLVILGALALKKRAVAWLVTTRRIEIERGVVARRIDTLELWRVRDVEFRQGIAQRLFGVATIVVLSHDEEQPHLELRGVPGDRALYDALTNAVMRARQQRKMLNVDVA
jgi:uncharacterized membrane protein YdbT with pleckstrin-like domain